MVNIQIISTETIKPSSRNHARNPSKYKINVLARTMPPVYIPLIFFYPPASTGGDIINESGFRVEQLKKSLSEALTLFFPLAGRIDEENLVVECNDEGAEFLEARVDPHVSLSDLLRSPDVELLSRMAPRSFFHVKSSSNVLLSIQANHFRCGGLAVVVFMSHKLGDAHSLASFINEWASTARGAGSGEQIMGPDLASSALFPVDGFVPESIIRSSESEVVVTKRLVFDSSKIAALRSRATGNDPKAELPTRYEAVSALIWRCLAKAGRREQGFAKSLSVHAVNLRGRMVPPLAENSFGDIMLMAPAAATRKELLEGGETLQQHVGLLARKIRNGIRKIDGEYIEELQRPDGLLKRMEGGGMVSKEVDKDRDHGGDLFLCYFTSWWRFPFYEADFGWGKPVWVSTISIPINNMTIFLSTSSGDGIEAWVNLAEEKMANFAQDEELLSFVSFPSINGLGST